MHLLLFVSTILKLLRVLVQHYTGFRSKWLCAGNSKRKAAYRTFFLHTRCVSPKTPRTSKGSNRMSGRSVIFIFHFIMKVGFAGVCRYSKYGTPSTLDFRRDRIIFHQAEPPQHLHSNPSIVISSIYAVVPLLFVCSLATLLIILSLK